MQKCLLTPQCAFYLGTMHKMPLGAEFLKRIFCERSGEGCHRLRLADDVSVDEPGNEITPLGRNFAP